MVGSDDYHGLTTECHGLSYHHKAISITRGDRSNPLQTVCSTALIHGFCLLDDSRGLSLIRKFSPPFFTCCSAERPYLADRNSVHFPLSVEI